jgi:hypothetical protein
LKAAIAATAVRATPLVFRAINFDPLAEGYIASLAHPRGNLTGWPVLTKRREMVRI